MTELGAVVRKQLTRLQRVPAWHRFRGHTIVVRPATKEDGCLTHTVVGGGFIVPIMLEVCSCGTIW